MPVITFQKCDIIVPHLDPLANEIADFLILNTHKFEVFCEFLRYSTGWQKNNYQSKLSTWKKLRFGRKSSPASDEKKFISFIDKFFQVCKNDDDIKKMRGLVPEKLMERIFNLRDQAKKRDFETGCIVAVDGTNIIYICSAPYNNGDDSDGTKKTVDIGIWDGLLGEFSEIKVSPDSFHTKDIKYLRFLAENLQSNNIDYKIYLIALKEKELTKKRLSLLTSYIEGEFMLIGRDDILGLRQVV